MPGFGYEGLFVLSGLLRAAPLALLFLALRPEQLPGRKWNFATHRVVLDLWVANMRWLKHGR